MESEFMKELLVGLSDRYFPNGLFWRRNVGVATPLGRDYAMRFGLKGQADIAGILNGRAIEIETKIGRGTQRHEQKNWQDAVERAGGLYFLVYPETDVFTELDKLT